jgi:hypothetical protein
MNQAVHVNFFGINCHLSMATWKAFQGRYFRFQLFYSPSPLSRVFYFFFKRRYYLSLIPGPLHELPEVRREAGLNFNELAVSSSESNLPSWCATLPWNVEYPRSEMLASSFFFSRASRGY